MKAYASREIKKKCNRFISEYKIKALNVKLLKDIIISQGYKIITFSPFCNDEDTESIIECLGVQEYIKSKSAFIYQDSEHRFLFLQRDLSDKEYLILLAHEEAHIYCGHIKNKMIIGQCISDEYEANEFVHYLFNLGFASKSKAWLSTNKKRLIPLAAAVLALAVAIGIIYNLTKPADVVTDYYAVATGEKYHLRDCRIIKNRNDVQKVTQKEIDNHTYEPCKICLPGKQSN